MPLYDQEGNEYTPEKPEDIVKPSFGTLLYETAKNTTIGKLGSIITDKFIAPENDIDPSFDPLDPNKIKGLEQYADVLVKANNEKYFNHLAFKIFEEEQTQKKVEEGGSLGIAASLVTGLADPINLLFGGPAKAVGGGLLKAGVSSKVAAAGGLAAAGAVAGGTYETLAQIDSPTRTAAESALNISMQTVIAGAVGRFLPESLGKEFKPQVALKKLSEKVDQELEAFAGSTVGAAQKTMLTPSSEMLPEEALTLKGTGGVAEKLSFIGPIQRSAQKQSMTARQLAMELAESPLERRAATLGIAQPTAVESLARQWVAKAYNSEQAVKDAFLEYRQSQGKVFAGMREGTKDLLGKTQGKLTFNEFKEEVGKAMIRGDKHENPYVQKVAELYRRDVIDPVKNRGIEVGLPGFKEGMKAKYAESYLTRLYDRAKIIAQRPMFVKTISEHFRSGLSNIERQIAELEAKGGEKALDKITELKIMKEMKPEEWESIAEEVARNILGTNGRMNYSIPPIARGPMIGRTLPVPSEVLEPWLEKDVVKVGRYYAKTVGTDAEIMGKFGNLNLKDQIAKINDDYELLRKDVANDPKKLKALDAEEKEAVSDILALLDRTRGVNKNYDPSSGLSRTIRQLKNWNYLTSLGGMTVSSMTDMSRVVMRNGLSNAYKYGFKPMVSNWKLLKMANKEMKLAGVGIDRAVSQTAKTIADIQDNYSSMSKFERGMDWMADRYGSTTLMNHWNEAVKTISSTVIQHSIVDTILNYEKATTKHVSRLATLGIGKKNVKKIAGQLSKYADDSDGAWIANTDLWDDAEAARTFRAALGKEINIEIVTPGQEIPLWITNSQAGFLAQFKSFAISSVERTLLTGLQDRDLGTLNGLVMALALGAGVYYLKTPNKRLSDDPAVWALEAVDRSGTTGILFDVNNVIEDITGNRLGFTAMAGQKASRYQGREPIMALGGPTLDKVGAATKSTAGAIQDILDPNSDFTKADLHQLRKMLPMQNLFYIRWLFDKAEESLGEGLGLPEKQSQARSR